MAFGERRAAARAIFEAKDSGADRAGHEHASVERIGADSARKRSPQAQQVSQAQEGTAQGTVVAPGPEGQLAAQQMQQWTAQCEEQQMEPRGSAAAQPHKRRAVSAATAVGAVGDGGQRPAEVTEIAHDTPARYGERVDRRGTRVARRRLGPYLEGLRLAVNRRPARGL